MSNVNIVIFLKNEVCEGGSSYLWLNTLFFSAHALWGGCIRFGYIHFLHSRHILSGGCLCIQVNTVLLLCQRHLVIVLQEFQNKQEIQRVQKLCQF